MLPITSMESVVPDACTLPTVERPLRLAEFEQLLRTAVAAPERAAPTTLRLTLAPDPEVAARAAHLATRETRCCSFFTFTVTVSAAGTTLTIEVPAEHTDVLDAIAAFAGGRGRRCGSGRWPQRPG